MQTLEVLLLRCWHPALDELDAVRRNEQIEAARSQAVRAMPARAVVLIVVPLLAALLPLVGAALLWSDSTSPVIRVALAAAGGALVALLVRQILSARYVHLVLRDDDTS